MSEQPPPTPGDPATPVEPGPAPAPPREGPPRTAGAKNIPVPAAVEPASPDVLLADEATPLPGAHRGGFLRLPTAPVVTMNPSAPAEPPGVEDAAREWQPSLSPAPARQGLANWALAFSIAGLVGSLFVGWGFPLGLVGVVAGILALRRPLESRGVAVWALVLGLASVIYSAGWLVYAAGEAGLFG